MDSARAYCNNQTCSGDYCRYEQERINRAKDTAVKNGNQLRRRYDIHELLEAHRITANHERTHMEIENGIAAGVVGAQSHQSPRAQILNEAMHITHHDRNANYGNPDDNFKHIANLWNDYLRVSRPGMPAITPADVAVMNMLIKVARLGNNAAHHDSAVDIAGYAACLGDIQASMRAHGKVVSGGSLQFPEISPVPQNTTPAK